MHRRPEHLRECDLAHGAARSRACHRFGKRRRRLRRHLCSRCPEPDRSRQHDYGFWGPARGRRLRHFCSARRDDRDQPQQVIETRDWTKAIEQESTSTSGARGGIVIVLGTPPTFGQPLDSSLWGYTEQTQVDATNAISTPIYEPGLPAVRVEHNVVRVPLDYALAIFGLGSIQHRQQPSWLRWTGSRNWDAGGADRSDPQSGHRDRNRYRLQPAQQRL